VLVKYTNQRGNNMVNYRQTPHENITTITPEFFINKIKNWSKARFELPMPIERHNNFQFEAERLAC